MCRDCSTYSLPTWRWSPTAAGWSRRFGLRSTGADVVARLLASFAKRGAGRRRGRALWLNGAPAARIDVDGVLDTAISLVIEDGRITRIFAMRNPDKLTRLDAEAALSR